MLRAQSPRERILQVFTVAAVAEIGWTIFIGLSLPRRYVATHWDLAWVGMDVTQVALMLLAAWAAWKRRALVIVFASSLGTLFLIDAWFDVTTARHGDLLESVILALVAEVPAAIALFWLTRRAMRRLYPIEPFAASGPVTPIRKVPLHPRSTERGASTEG
jgi:hypothetical protein